MLHPNVACEASCSCTYCGLKSVHDGMLHLFLNQCWKTILLECQSKQKSFSAVYWRCGKCLVCSFQLRLHPHTVQIIIGMYPTCDHHCFTKPLESSQLQTSVGIEFLEKLKFQNPFQRSTGHLGLAPLRSRAQRIVVCKLFPDNCNSTGEL